MNIFDATGLVKNNTGGLANYDVIILRDEKAQNTGGGSFTSGAWQTRTLNTEVVDTGGYCTLSSNQFTLLSGTYEISATVPGYFCSRHQSKLYNVTDSSDTIFGSSEFAADAETQTISVISGRFTIASTKTFEIRHRCESTSNIVGFGVQSNFATEVYTQVFLRKTPATTTGLGLTDASQAQQEAGTATTVYVTPGRQQYHPSAAKAWVNFNGTGTVAIRTSYNVTSITDNGTGDYSVNWDVDFSSANYSSQITTSRTNSNTSLIPANRIDAVNTPTAGVFRFQTGVPDGSRNLQAEDCEFIMVSAFGDQ